jgi:hypothetical protein
MNYSMATATSQERILRADKVWQARTTLHSLSREKGSILSGVGIGWDFKEKTQTVVGYGDPSRFSELPQEIDGVKVVLRPSFKTS